MVPVADQLLEAQLHWDGSALWQSSPTLQHTVRPPGAILGVALGGVQHPAAAGAWTEGS